VSCRVVSCRVVSCRVVSCRFVSSLALSYPILSRMRPRVVFTHRTVDVNRLSVSWTV
jgi:hypothetical protein